MGKKKKTAKKLLAVSLLASVLVSSMPAVSVSAWSITRSADIPEHRVGVVGGFNGWENDIELTDYDGDGVYKGVVEVSEVTEDMIIGWNIDDNPTGEEYLQFKVRLDGEWTDSWGYYEPLNDRTYCSQSNVPVKEAVVGRPIKFTVYFDIKNPNPAAVANPDSYAEPGSDDYYYLHVWYEIIEEEPKEITDFIYFDNSETKWNEVYTYWWNSNYERTYDLNGKDWGYVKVYNEDGTQSGQPAEYPGTKMTKIAGTDIWKVKIPFNAQKMIFNNGTSEDAIRNGAVGYKTSDISFNDQTNAGQIYTVSGEAKAGRGVEKTWFKYASGAWSDYHGEYQDVSVSDEYYYRILEDDTVEIIALRFNMDTSTSRYCKSLIIPETIDGRTVTAISSERLDWEIYRDAFGFFEEQFYSVTIPETVKDLSRFGFLDLGVRAGFRSVVFGKKGSEAERFAAEHDILFAEIPNNAVKSGDYVYAENGDGTINIIRYDGKETDIVVPTEIDGKKVLKIGDCAYLGNPHMKTLKVPGSIEYIGGWAFAYSNLQKAEMEEGIKDIDVGAFAFDIHLEEITIPKSASTSSYSFNGTPWFSGQSDEFVIVGDNVLIKYNGTDKRVVIPTGVKYITSAFYDTVWANPYNQSISEIEEVVIPDSVEYIWGDAFYGLSNVKEIVIPDSVKEIGGGAFLNCTGLETIVIPASVTSMPHNDTFFGCDFDKLTIYGEKGSRAETYANENNIKFVSVNGYTNVSTISADEIALGGTVTVNAKAVLGKGDYTYAVQYKKKSDTKWTTKQNYSTNDIIVIEPAKATDYDICVKVKDSSGKIVKKFFEVKVNEKLANTSTISAGTIEKGDTLTVKGSATGGVSKYKYAVLYKKKADTKWTTKQNYSTNDTITIKPANATDYDVCTKVQDSTGTIIKKFFEVTVEDHSLKNTSTISATTIEKGDSVTVNGSATGGKGEYKYAVLYRKKADTKWTVRQNYSTNDTIAIKPANATDYDICIKVQDSTGTIVKKFFEVNVEDHSLKNISTISETTIVQGDVVTVNGSATGGKGSYTYAALYKKKTDTKWTTKQNYSTNDTIIIKPAHETDYDICVKVKDETDTVVKKFFEVGVKKLKYSIDSDNTATITGYEGNDSKLSIPDKIYGCTVTSIDRYAFSDCESLKSVIIPDSVTSIGYRAFYGCTGLASVTIPNGVTWIDDYAFYGCKSLTSVTIPNGVTSIGDYAFYGCKSLTGIIIPDSVDFIRSEAFAHCESLTSITIPNGVNSIGSYAFYGCTNLANVKIGSGATSIGDSAFEDCVSLTSINVDQNNWNYSSVNGVLFNKNKTTLVAYSSGKTGTYTIPNSVKTIGNSAFCNCKGLTGITIPDSVTSIGYSAFYGCTGLTSITIPDSVTSIGYSAFYGCTGLTSITIPDGVTSIGNYAFYGCTSLTSITIPDGVTSIGNYVFYGCTGLTSITISDGVTSIGNYAFYGCTGLTSVTIGNGVTSIYDNTFSCCTSLTSVTIGNGVTSIGNDAFYDCYSLNNINVGKGNSQYSSDNGVLLNKNKTEIIYCPKGKNGEYSIPDSVTSIGSNAFLLCEYLTSIIIPNSVTSIGGGAFWGCTGLTSVTISESVTSISNDAFCGCTGLTSVIIPDSVTSIGNYAFDNCKALTSITIPDSVTSIGYSAFYGCKKLTIYGAEESYAEIYAWQNNIPFAEC